MKLILNIDELTEDFFICARLLGIMASAKNYRFCWQVNNVGYHFKLKADSEIHLRRKGRDYFFFVYEDATDNNNLRHFIYQNQFDGEYLLPEFKHLDFLWLIKGDHLDDAQCAETIQSIKNISGVQLVAELTYEKIKNKGNLVF